MRKRQHSPATPRDWTFQMGPAIHAGLDFLKAGGDPRTLATAQLRDHLLLVPPFDNLRHDLSEPMLQQTLAYWLAFRVLAHGADHAMVEPDLPGTGTRVDMVLHMPDFIRVAEVKVSPLCTRPNNLNNLAGVKKLFQKGAAQVQDAVRALRDTQPKPVDGYILHCASNPGVVNMAWLTVQA